VNPSGIRVICTPIRAPNANALGERWVETLRADCLDGPLILGPRHLDRVLRIYLEHYNQKRDRIADCSSWLPKVLRRSKRSTACRTYSGEIFSVD
jgi:hypothetical protein